MTLRRNEKCCDECPGDDTCPHAAVCMCGDYANHSPWHGHSPVSMHDYYCEAVDGAQITTVTKELSNG
jgi:hypothetical protein